MRLYAPALVLVLLALLPGSGVLLAAVRLLVLVLALAVSFREQRVSRERRERRLH